MTCDLCRCWFTSLAFATAWLAGPAGQLAATDSNAPRAAKWAAVLANRDFENWEFRRRVVQEIAASGDRSEKISAVLLALPDRGASDPLDDLVFALRGMVSPRMLERALADPGAERSVVVVCQAVGLLGKEGKDYVPLLRKLVSEPARPKEVTLTARIALANLGDGNTEDIALIRSALDDTTALRRKVLWNLLFSGSDGWITEAVTQQLCAILEENSPYYAGQAAAILSRLAARSALAKAALAKALERARADPRGQGGMIHYGFAYARSEAGPSATRFREPVKLLGKPTAGFDLPMRASMMLITRFGMDSKEAQELIGLLKDKDLEVVLGAAKLCWGLGIAAQGAEKDLLAMLKSGHELEFRAVAAFALGAVAGEACLPELRGIAAKESCPELKEAITQSINLIMLQSGRR